MNKIDWKRKLTSRKWWLSLTGFITGLIIAFGGSDKTATTVSGCLMSGAAVLAYTIGEGLADSSNNKEDNTDEN
mgnify:FL=1